MKKNLLFGFLILFALNTSAFAGLSDPKNGSDKPSNRDPKENRLSDEEISRLSKPAETDNLKNSNLMNKEKNDSKNNLKQPSQDYRHHHHGYYYGGATLILLIILIVILV